MVYRKNWICVGEYIVIAISYCIWIIWLKNCLMYFNISIRGELTDISFNRYLKTKMTYAVVDVINVLMKYYLFTHLPSIRWMIQCWTWQVRTMYSHFTWSLDITWWRHLMETFSALLAPCAGNSLVTGEFRSQRPVTRSFDVFLNLRLNKMVVLIMTSS